MERLVERIRDNRDFIFHIIKYLIIGGLTTLVNILSFWLLTNITPLGASEVGQNFANVIAIAISIVFAYFTNRGFVFESNETNKVKEFAKFVGARGITMLLDVALFFLFATLFHMNEMVVKVAIQILVIILNYVFSRILVFKKS